MRGIFSRGATAPWREKIMRMLRKMIIGVVALTAFGAFAINTHHDTIIMGADPTPVCPTPHCTHGALK
jgi:hypothetical protein